MNKQERDKILELADWLTKLEGYTEDDWRDEKPKYIIRLYGNGRWQMEG